MSDGEAGRTRSIEMEITVEAPPEAVWEALSTGQGLEGWFPPEARVEPGVGGSIFLSWGGGMEGTGEITVWEPNRRIVWSEPVPPGAPAQILVDFEIQAEEGGGTRLRLVHSGFGASADWDEYYDGVKAGWTYFLFHLAWYVVRHRGRVRQMIRSRRKTTRPVAEVWRSLLGRAGVDASSAQAGSAYTLKLDGTQTGRVEFAREPKNFAGTLTSLNDGLLFIEMEGGSPEWHCGVWVSVYGQSEERVSLLQSALDALMDAEFGEV